VPVSIVVIAGLLLYTFFYLICGRYLAKNIVKVSDKPTPAYRLYDGVDYVPANKYVLFGHHFASIAGAAPIVGPAIGIAWGWGAALLWIWLGNIFIGAVHDYLSLMSSVRYDGHSVHWIAGKVIKQRTRYVFAIFILFALILVVAAFGAVLGKLFVHQPAIPTACLIQTIGAVVLGIMLYKLRIPLSVGTIFAIICLILSVIIGKYYPIKAPYSVWMIIFLLYIVIAASLPVQFLLQPRDYMNAWLLVAGLVLGGISLIFTTAKISFPAFTSFSPIIVAGQPTPFWPVIVLIIACGSLSGFHSLVASGTTSKQLSKEIEGLFIGYGGMLAEGLVSTIVVTSIATYGFSVLSPEQVALLKTDFATNIIKIEKNIGGPIAFFSKSYGTAVNAVFGLSKELIIILASMWVAAFALTTLDTTNRLARYTLTELAEPLEKVSFSISQILTNRWIASLIPAIIGIWFAWSGAWTVIWPAFGGANQMLASIALLTAAAWVVKVQKTKGTMVIIPAMFLWITVTCALIWFLIKAVPTYMHKSHVMAYILGIVVVIMLILNFILIFDYLTTKEKKVESHEF